MKKIMIIVVLLALTGCGGRSGVPTAPRNGPLDADRPRVTDTPSDIHKFTGQGAVWVP